LLVLAASAASVVWQVETQRQNEAELLFDGQQFAAALRSYAKRHASLYPTSLKQLLRDDQGLEIHRDLRRMYVDPLTGSTDWGLVRTANGTIVAIYSKSTRKPIKNSNFPIGLESFSDAKNYQDWIFRPLTQQQQPDQPAAPPESATPGTPASPSSRRR
jgi:type II secretory pathway pseudopilin PulG